MLIVNPAVLLELITVVYVKIWSGQFPVLPKPDTLPKKPLCHFCSQHSLISLRKIYAMKYSRVNTVFKQPGFK